MLLYYITDRMQFPGDENSRCQALLARIAEAARCGIDVIQLRERDLPSCALETLARAAVRAVRENSAQTRLLINSRTDVALASGADGVHLRSDDISPADVRMVWKHGKGFVEPYIAASFHTPSEIEHAASAGIHLAVFGPVFEKKNLLQAPVGTADLHEACRHEVSVLALGGVTVENAGLCLAAGAAGVAGIRIFQKGPIEKTVRRLRANLATSHPI